MKGRRQCYLMLQPLFIFVCVKVEYDEQGCFLESPYLFGEDQKYAHYMQVTSSALPPDDACFLFFWPDLFSGFYLGPLIFRLSLMPFQKLENNCFLQFAQVNSVVTMVLGGAGIFGNLLSVIVLSRSRSVFHIFSFCICIFYLYL